jgi:3-oxoacyl-[acyl-carrier protein] reductase
MVESPMAKLQDKVAIVTGASKGIGAAIATALAKAGASVVVNYATDKYGADKVVQAIARAGGVAIAVKGNVASRDEADALVNAAIERFGRLDILVNNAGVHSFAPIGSLTEDEFRWMFDTNVLGTLLVTQAAAKHLSDGGSIINLSSAVTSALPPGSAVYTGSKGAIDTITGVLAAEMGPRKIRVNAINPGMTETEGTRASGAIGSEAEAGAVAQTPLGRVGRPEDIADVAVFLASDDARWLTGEKLTTSGGLR